MKFGQYELLELIAVGGMAEVYKGRVVGAEGFEKYVAIKRILPDLAEDERFVKMLLTEARIHSGLSHRNIVQIHDLGISEDGEYFIVLEYVEGYDLRVINDQLAAAGEIIPEALSLHIAAEVAQGLHFAHDLRGSDGQPLGLVHRDVSPSNVLVSMAGEVKLSDFGLAKRRQDRSVVGSLKGNLTYMSPEQARLASLDRRTDVFSLGAVLFEMLTGRRLREITDEVAGWGEVASGAVRAARSVRPDLPEPFEHLLDGALAADPERRYPDAAAFALAIRELLAEMNTPVGASDLQALLDVLSPPRRPRRAVEQSKVIRLGPEAQALGEAIAMPSTPPPILLAPDPRSAAAAAAAARQIAAPLSAEFDEMPATPPPQVFPSPVWTRTLTPSNGAGARNGASGARRSPTPGAGARTSSTPDPGPTPPGPIGRPTPRGPLPLTRPRTPPVRGPSPAAGAGASMAMAPAAPSRPRMSVLRTAPGLAPEDALAQSVHTVPTVRNVPIIPTIQPVASVQTIPSWGGAAAVAAVPRWNEPRHQVAYAANGFGAAAVATAQMRNPRRRHQTPPHVQAAPSGAWRAVVVVAAALVLGFAFAVHAAVVPLDVLVTWDRPATLLVASEPDGATLKLDGVALPAGSPARVSVHRDRINHVLEASRPGYRSTREVIRYDRSLVLSETIRLEKQAAAPALELSPAPAPGIDRPGVRAGAATTGAPPAAR
jgi:serine/threonine-protein kinase